MAIEGKHSFSDAPRGRGSGELVRNWHPVKRFPGGHADGDEARADTPGPASLSPLSDGSCPFPGGNDRSYVLPPSACLRLPGGPHSPPWLGGGLGICTSGPGGSLWASVLRFGGEDKKPISALTLTRSIPSAFLFHPTFPSRVLHRLVSSAAPRVASHLRQLVPPKPALVLVCEPLQ